MTITISLTSTTSNVSVASGTTLIVEPGGTARGIAIASGGTVVGQGGTLSAGGSSGLVNNDGSIKTGGSNGFLAIVGSTTNLGSIVASATDKGGDAEILLSGGTVLNGGSIQAVATSATTVATVDLSDTVNGGLIYANGSGASVYIDGANIVGATLGTANRGTIGVFGGGTATAANTTVSKGAFILDDGLLAFTGGAVGTGVSAVVAGLNASLTFTSTTFGATDNLAATAGGNLIISGGNSSSTFSAGSIVSATYYGDVDIVGPLTNSATLQALTRGGNGVVDTLSIEAGSAGAVTNAAAGIIEAQTLSGYFGSATANISGGAATNSGVIEALANLSYFGAAAVNLNVGSLYNTKTIAAIATSNTTADANLVDAGAITNSGTMLASAGQDSAAYLSIVTSGGALSNSKSIQATATTNAVVGLEIADTSSNGTTILTNATGATLGVSLAGASFLQYLAIDVGSTIKNLGTISEVAATDSYTSNSAAADFISGFSLTNSGVINATATGSSTIYGFDIGVTDLLNNTSTIVASASGNSYVNVGLAGGTVRNAKSITANAGTGGTAGMTISSFGYAGSAAQIANTGTIAAVAAGGAATMIVDTSFSRGSVIANLALMQAAAASNRATLDILANGSSAKIINTSAIEATATGGTAGVYLGGSNGVATSVNNLNATLLATATAGTAFVDLGTYHAAVSAGTLKTVGANAEIGVYNGGLGSAINVSIAPGSRIVGWGGTLTLLNIDGAVTAGSLVQAANNGTVDINGNLTNSGTIQALGNSTGTGNVVISGAGTIDNAKQITALNNSFDTAAFIQLFTGAGGSALNSGSIIGSANLSYAGDTSITISGGTIENLKNANIQIVATSNSYNYSDNYAAVQGTAIINSGTMLASAGVSSDDYMSISGSTVSNFKLIEAVATQQSYAEVDIYGSLVNSGTLEASGAADSEAAVYLIGTVANTSGVISAAGNGVVHLHAVTVTGGTLATSGSQAAIVADTLDAGAIDGSLIAKGAFVLAENGGSITLGNNTSIGASAVVEAAAATVTVGSGATVVNSGTLIAQSMGEILVEGTVTNSGSGAVVIGPLGFVDVVSGGTASVTFAANCEYGILQIADSAGTTSAFTGTVSGFGGINGAFPGQLIDLANYAYNPATAASFSASFSGSPTGGTLTVTSGSSAIAAIDLVGNYTHATFSVVSNTITGDFAVSDPTGTIATGATTTLAPVTSNGSAPSNAVNASSVALLGSYMATLFASAEGQIGNSTEEASSQNIAQLAHPHT